MLKLGAWLLFPVFCLPIQAQVLPEEIPVVPPVDMITPVPLPEISFEAAGETPMAMPANLNIDSNGPISGSQEGGVRYEGPGVKIVGDNGLEIFADSAVVDFKSASVTLEGNVSVFQGTILQRGDRAVYFYERKFLDASSLRVSLDPILLEAGKFTVEERNGKNVYIGEDGGITTHDVKHPNFWIRAKKTTIFPNDKIVFDDLRIYAGDTPVFWLPYLSQPLDPNLGYHFVPGSRSNWGPYLLNSYGVMLGGTFNEETQQREGAWLLSRYRFDLRATRGIGAGVDFVDTRIENAKDISGLSFYYLNDLAPDTERAGTPRGFVNEDRYQIQLKQRWELDLAGDADWRVDANLTFLSDRFYLQDFSTTNYRTDPAPDNTLAIYRRDDRSLLSLLGRFRLNDFYRADTRLPELAYDQARGPIFDLPILHEGTTSLGMIGEKASDPTARGVLNPLFQLTAADPAAQPLLNQLNGFDRILAQRILALPLGDPRRKEIQNQLLDSNYSRFNTYQEFSLPQTFGNFLNLTPQAGVGITQYEAVDGPVDSLTKSNLHVGAETSVKLSKDLGSYTNHDWGIEGLKHVLQPYAFWSYISTNDYDRGDPFTDRLTPTTRPRPLDPVRFTAIDELQNWNVVRLGSRNSLLTQRDRQSYEWLFVDTYVDAFITDPERQRDFSNLYNEARWQPLPWVGVDVETQLPIASGGSGFNEFATRVRILPTDSFEISLGYRVLNSHPVLTDSNRVELETYTRLSENWGIGTHHTLEFDDGTLELEQYTVQRDLGNWVAGVGFTHRDNRLEQEYGVIFSLTLKDFPSLSLPFQIDAE